MPPPIVYISDDSGSEGGGAPPGLREDSSGGSDALPGLASEPWSDSDSDHAPRGVPLHGEHACCAAGCLLCTRLVPSSLFQWALQGEGHAPSVWLTHSASGSQQAALLELNPPHSLPCCCALAGRRMIAAPLQAARSARASRASAVAAAALVQGPGFSSDQRAVMQALTALLPQQQDAAGWAELASVVGRASAAGSVGSRGSGGSGGGVQLLSRLVAAAADRYPAEAEAAGLTERPLANPAAAAAARTAEMFAEELIKGTLKLAPQQPTTV